jgi:predicted nucleotidyltransferase
MIKALIETINKLEKSPLVAAVLLYGSYATNQNSKNSDYDILVILYENIPISSSFSYIDGVPADIFYTTVKNISSINYKKIFLDTKDDWLAYWIQTGYVCFDKTGIIVKFKKKKCTRIVDKTKKYNCLYRLNHDFIQNFRFYNSSNLDDKITLQIKLLHSISQILPIFFCLNDMSWRGEKFALEYIKKNDLKFYNLYSSCLLSSFNKKFELYNKVVVYMTKQFGGLWKKNISIDSSQEIQNKNKGKSFWDKLINK